MTPETMKRVFTRSSDASCAQWARAVECAQIFLGSAPLQINHLRETVASRRAARSIDRRSDMERCDWREKGAAGKRALVVFITSKNSSRNINALC